MQPIVFHHIMDRVRAAGWQIRQTGAGLEVFCLLSRTRSMRQVWRAISARPWRPRVLPPPVQINQVMAIPRMALGKAPLITKNVV